MSEEKVMTFSDERRKHAEATYKSLTGETKSFADEDLLAKGLMPDEEVPAEEPIADVMDEVEVPEEVEQVIDLAKLIEDLGKAKDVEDLDKAKVKEIEEAVAMLEEAQASAEKAIALLEEVMPADEEVADEEVADEALAEVEGAEVADKSAEELLKELV